mmetsp:Transcript_17491/g.50786  ORF Transcript_17491/g.50786 Transcript_17491/m.50786 type:complete len:626 (+) Transcript_17491:499-2376(+)
MRSCTHPTHRPGGPVSVRDSDVLLRRGFQGHVELLRHLEHVPQGRVRVVAPDHDVRDPRGHALLGARDPVALLDEGLGVDDAGLLGEVGERLEGEHLARLLGVDVVIGEGAVGRVRLAGAVGDAHGGEERLLHQVHVVDEEVGVAHLPAAHARVDLDEPWAARRVLEFHVEDARGEAARLERGDGHLLELCALGLVELRGAESPGLVEVGLHGGPVVDDHHVLRLALRHDHVHVNLRTVQVLLQHEETLDVLLLGGQVQLREALALHGGQVAVDGLGLDQRARADDRRLHLLLDVVEGLVQLLLRVRLLDAQGRGARDGLEHRGEAHVRHARGEVGGVADERVGHGGEASVLHGLARGMLVAREVDGGRGRRRQAQRIGKARDHGHGQFAERADACRPPHHGVVLQRADHLERILEDGLRVLLHVEGDELFDDVLVNELGRPAVRAVNDHGRDAELLGALVDEALALVTWREEDNRRPGEQRPAQRLAILARCGGERGVEAGEGLMGYLVLHVLVHLRLGKGRGQGTRHGHELLRYEVPLGEVLPLGRLVVRLKATHPLVVDVHALKVKPAEGVVRVGGGAPRHDPRLLRLRARARRRVGLPRLVLAIAGGEGVHGFGGGRRRSL